MPATGVRVTFVFQEGVFGFSETHTYTQSNEITAQVKKDAADLLAKRMKLCGFGVEIYGVRMSREGVFRDSQVFDATDLAKVPIAAGNIGTSTGEQPNNADQTKACVLVRAEAGTLRRKPIYLAGVPDVVIRTNPNGPAVAQVPVWEKAFSQWAGLLAGGKWGFVGRADAAGNLAPRIVLGVTTQGGTGLLGLICAAAGQAFTVGQDVQCRLFQMQHPAYQPVNGEWQIATVVDGPGAGQVTYFLTNSNNVAAATIKRFGTIQLIDYSTHAYTLVQAQGQTTRKRGNRFLAGPGRVTTRKYIPT